MSNNTELKNYFTAGIFLISFLSLLLVSFNAMLQARITPVKQDITEVKQDITDLKSDIKELRTLIITSSMGKAPPPPKPTKDKQAKVQ